MKLIRYASLMILFVTLMLGPVVAQNPANLKLNNLDGENVGIADFQGRIVVLSFSAKGIPLMQVELPQLERLATKYANQGITVLWVSTNSQKQKTNNFATNDELRTIAGQYPHLNVLRISDESYRQLGIDTLPTILVLDQQGKPVGKPHAGIDPQANLANDLSPIINRLLAK